VTVKRRYRSEVRSVRALATRDAITAAARRLFASRGYAATSIETIAKEAGVAVQTVYAIFGSKRAVLESLLDALDDQAGLDELGRALANSPPLDQAAAVARFLTRLFTRGADIIAAARAAGAGDPALRALARKGLARHHQGMTRIAQGWARAGVLRPDLSARDATAILEAITSYEVFHHLRAAGWTLKHYQHWLGATIATLALEAPR
jgi:AcrR family transcriptional regulator